MKGCLYHRFTRVSSGAEELSDSRLEKQMFLLQNRLLMSESTHGTKHTTTGAGDGNETIRRGCGQVQGMINHWGDRHTINRVLQFGSCS